MTTDQIIEEVRKENKRLRLELETYKQMKRDNSIRTAYLEAMNQNLFELNKQMSNRIRELERINRL